MNLIVKDDTIINKDTGETITPIFDLYDSKEKYEESEVRPIKPMTAKEEKNEGKLEKMLEPNSGYIVEEKFDGTRATVHIGKEYSRAFSRRISRKTGWYVENTDLIPHIRAIGGSDIEGTILDGEFIIPDYPFKDVSSTLNCNWDKAIKRQIEKNLIVLKAFDIVYYKGVNVKQAPLRKRKELLKRVVAEIDSPYIEEVEYSDLRMTVEVTNEIINKYKKGKLINYPNLYNSLESILDMRKTTDNFNDIIGLQFDVNKKTYYEYIVANGGEGLIVKDLEGIYRHKRGKQYTKIKKFDTWDVIVIGYADPTKEYTGKELDSWDYFDAEGNPVTKYYAKDWIGAIEYGVIANDEEIEAWEKRNKEDAPIQIIKIPKHKDLTTEEVAEVEYTEVKVLKVGEASGMTEEMREEFSRNKSSYLGTCIEIKGQEVIKKTGKLRHPQFLRTRPDKDIKECTWSNHIRR